MRRRPWPETYGSRILSDLLFSLFRQKTRGLAAKAQLVELFNDEPGLTAALIGTLFIATGWLLADPIASIVVATMIAVTVNAQNQKQFVTMLEKRLIDLSGSQKTRVKKVIKEYEVHPCNRSGHIGPEGGRGDHAGRGDRL